MRARVKLAGAACAIGLALAGQTAEAEVAGMWRNGDDAAIVALHDCPDGLCGDFVRQPEAGADLALVAGFRQRSATRWEGGRVYNMNDGATYSVDLELLAPELIEARICWLAFCETQLWRRMK